MFVTAIKSEPDAGTPSEYAAVDAKPITLPKLPKNGIKAAQGDEIDQVLKEFSEKSMTIAKAKGAEKQSQKKIDFAKELQALTKTPKQGVKTALAKSSDVAYYEVTVKKGDALEKIARTHQSSVGEIMEMNRLRTTMLRIGQVLKVPRGTGGQGGRGGRGGSQKQGNAEYYTVKLGDNPWTIAVKNHIKVHELLQINELDETSARRIKPGDELRIR